MAARMDGDYDFRLDEDLLTDEKVVRAIERLYLKHMELEELEAIEAEVKDEYEQERSYQRLAWR